MIADIGTILRKEWRELMSAGRSRGRLSVVILVAVFGIVVPLQTGRAWVTSPVLLAYWIWVPMFLVVSVVADSFAGERERHTLETLLASRLPDRAILFGKILSSTSYGLGITWLSLLLGLVTVNLSHGSDGLLLYSPTMSIGIVTLSVLGAGLAAGAGVLVSLRAATVRQAQQTLSVAIMVLLFVPMFGTQALPAAWRSRLFTTLTAAGLAQLLVAVAGLLVVVDVAVLLAAMARFRRARLISQ